MKKSRILQVVATVVLATMISACAKNDQTPSAQKKSTLITAMSPDSKVSFQELDGNKIPMQWSDVDEKIRAYCRANGGWETATVSTGYSCSENRKQATFTIDLPDPVASSRDYYILSPSSMGYQILAANASDFLDKVRLDSKITPQVPSANGPDSRYILMISKNEGFTEIPTHMDVDFNVLESFGKMTVTGLEAASVSSITITFPGETHVTGFLDYKISTDEVILTKANSSTNYIEIDPKNISVNPTSFDVWFGIFPQTFEAGTPIKFAFTTPSGDITKEVTVPAGKSLAFNRGKATGFGVDMTGCSVSQQKTLTFDFSVNTAGLETNAYAQRQGKTVTFTADDGNSYNFWRGGGLFFTNPNRHTLYEDTSAGATNAYFGLPAIPGYKLVSIAADRTNNTGATVYLEITDTCPKTSDSQSLTGSITWSAGIAKPAVITLAGTSVNTMYYMHSLNKTWVPFNALTLVYESN